MGWSPRTSHRILIDATPNSPSVTPLTVKKGGLVTARYNKLRDGVADLAGKAFTPSHVRNDPLMYSGCDVNRASRGKRQQRSYSSARGHGTGKP